MEKRQMKKLLILLLLPMLVVASGDDDGNDIDIDVGGGVADAAASSSAVSELSGGDQINKHSAVALSQSLGDVDIGRAAACVVTEQYGIIIWQRQNWEYDPWCIAGLLDEQGKHLEAAQMRCFHKPTAKLYGDNCVATLIFLPPADVISDPIPKPVEEVISPDEDDDDDLRYSVLLERIDKIEKEKAANVRRYNRDQAALQTKKQADRDYAQQTLDELAEYHTNEPQ